MAAHDEVISALMEVLEQENGEIRLLGRINDPVINNRSDREVFLFVPDLHVISPERQERFGRYGFNHAETNLLARLLLRLEALRSQWELDGDNKLVTVQLGDFFDLWREFPRAADPDAIGDDVHGQLRDVLYRGLDRGEACLRATMILGNHDTKRGIPLEEIPFRLKSFNRSGDGNPFLFTNHGDAFDIIERLVPDPIQEFVVNFIGSLTPTNKYWVGNWGKAASEINKRLGDMEEAVVAPNHVLDAVSGAPRVEPDTNLPVRLAVEVDSADGVDHGSFEKYYRSIIMADGAGTVSQSLRVVAIGHTHHAAMILCEPGGGGRPLLMMDVGAWIENCSYPLEEGGPPVQEPSAQLGVIHGNDARIYQIRTNVPA
jgi:hypothetical protein